MRELERMEENQIQTPPVHVGQNQETPSQHKSSNLKSPDDSFHSGSRTNGIRREKLPWIIIAVLLVLVGIFGGYFVLGQMKNNSQTPTPAPDQKACTQEAKLCPDGSSVGRSGPNCEFEACPSTAPTSTTSSILEKTFTSPTFKDLLSGYNLKYPSDWSLTELRSTVEKEGIDSSKVTISKDKYSIVILQVPMGGGGCIYEGVVPEGPMADLRGKPYVDVEAGFGSVRRTEADVKTGGAYSFCQKSKQDGTYVSITSVGTISYTTPQNPIDSILTEMDNIIKSITTL